MQPLSSQDPTYSGSSSPPRLDSDELVGGNLLLKKLLVCHSSHILRPNFDKRKLNKLYMQPSPFYLKCRTTKHNEKLNIENLDAL